MLATLFHLALKIKAVRKVPEGICKRCLGSGNGEEIADLGEALCHSSEFPSRKCSSCGGSGMAISKTETTALGLLLLLLIPAAIWALPQSILFILTLSLMSIGVVEVMLWRYRESEEKAASPEAKQTPREIFAVSDTPGPPTEGVLSLIDALESSRQTVIEHEPDMARSIKPSHQDH
jgi:hypothetical protein